MTIQFVREYLIALPGLVIGGGVGFALGAARAGAVATWDARVTLPLLLAAAGAHLVLIATVEPTRQVLFGLYALALLGVVAFALVGWSIWRLGGVVFPAGSIAAYVYFAVQVHQADFVGVFVKLIELAAVAAVIVPVLRSESRRPARIAA